MRNAVWGLWQITSGVLSLSLSLLRDCRMHRPELHKSANFINSLRITIACGITVLNVFITAFDSRIIPVDPLQERPLLQTDLITSTNDFN